MAISIVESGKKLESVIDFSKFINQFKKNWWKILLVPLVVTAAAFPKIKGMQSIYVSTATVLIKAQADNVTKMEQVDGYDSTRDPYYETLYSLMQSRVILEKAVKELKLDQDPKFYGSQKMTSEDTIPNYDAKVGFSAPLNQNNATVYVKQPIELSTHEKKRRINEAVQTLSKHLSISGVRLTQLATVTYESEDPALAAKIANGVAKAYIDYTIEKKVEKTKAAHEWNKKRLEELKTIMLHQKAEIQQLLKTEGLLTFKGIDGFQTEQLDIQMSKVADSQEDTIYSKARYDSINDALKSSSTTNIYENIISSQSISQNAQIQDLRNDLINAKTKLAKLQKRYGPKYPEVIEAQSQLSIVNNQIRLVLLELKKGIFKEYKAALTKQKYFEANLAKLKKEFQDLAVKKDKYDTLKTDLDKTRELYQSIYQRTQENLLSAKYEEADTILYDPAVPATTPSKPNRGLFLIMVCLGSLIMSVGVFIIMTAFKSSIDNLQKLTERTGLIPLGELGIEYDDLFKTFESTNQQYQVEEFIFGIRSKWLLSEKATLINGQQAKSIVFLGVEKGEGASSLAYLVAQAFSQDHKTLIIDLDFRNSNSLTNLFDFESAPGVADVIKGKAYSDEIVCSINHQIDFIPKGQLTGSPLLLLSSLNMHTVIGELSEQYERIFIDVAEVANYKDALLVSKVVDAGVWVIQAEKLSANVIMNSINKVTNVGLPFIGGILNKVPKENMQSEEGFTLIETSGENWLSRVKKK